MQGRWDKYQDHEEGQSWGHQEQNDAYQQQPGN